MHRAEALGLLLNELKAAEAKHPLWPADIIHQAAILAEESGEVVKESIDVFYKGKNTDDFQKEVAQVGAMALRILVNMRKR